MMIISLLLPLLFIAFFIILFSASKSMDSNQNSSKYAFFYMLSLVALIFSSISIGMIAFQIINKSFTDPLNLFQGRFSSGALRFAISALVIAAPIYFVTMRQIFKSMASGLLGKDSEVRKWLTYFILFVSTVVMIGWLIATLNNFLNGELTVKFILKAATSIIISGIIFSFYFYDIRRKEAVGKDIILQAYFYGALALVIVSLVASFFFIESPAKVRARNHDRQILANLSQIDDAVNVYYNKEKAVPEKLEDLFKDQSRQIFITEDALKDPANGKFFDYKKLAANSYEICATFNLSNKESEKDDSEIIDPFLEERWAHESGFQCFTKKAELLDSQGSPIKPIEAR